MTETLEKTMLGVIENIKGLESERQSMLKHHIALKHALQAMCEEFRQLDLPYGSEAYKQAMQVLNAIPTP